MSGFPIETFMIYIRLVVYPILAYSLIVYGYSVLYDRCKNESKLMVLFAIIFVLLWGSSIVYLLTRDNQLVVSYNSIGLIPVLIFATLYIWIQVIRYNRFMKKKAKGEIENEHKSDV